MSTDSTRTWARPVPARAWVAPVVAAARAAAFWLAVVLPLTYVPLVALAPPIADPMALVAVAAVNLLALAVGHGHEPSLDRLGRRD